MTFKTNLAMGACPALGGFGLLACEGRDSGAFLQAQTMNDVAALTPGQCHWNGWLNPKGRLIALFLVLRLAPDRWLLVLPDCPAGLLQEQMQRFVMRSQVRMQPATALVAAGGPAPDGLVPGAWIGSEADGLAMAWPAAAATRCLWLLPSDHPALAPGGLAFDQAWLADDLAAGLPRLPEQGREAWTPHMLSLERLPALSLKKGCYPGQEIVARTHYLGQSKRGLARLAGVGLVPGQGVESDGQVVGTVACATADGRQALAVLARDAHGDLSAGGQACQRLALPADA